MSFKVRKMEERKVVRVALAPKTAEAYEHLAQALGLSVTETVNQALACQFGGPAIFVNEKRGRQIEIETAIGKLSQSDFEEIAELMGEEPKESQGATQKTAEQPQDAMPSFGEELEEVDPLEFFREDK